MRADTPAISASEAAFLLRAKLGPIRAWGDFLSDNVRGRQSIHGLTLKPCSRKKIGRGWRPMYAVKAVEKFIADVLAIEPNAGRAPITPVVLAVDSRLPWRMNKFDATGAPVAMMPRISSHASTLAITH